MFFILTVAYFFYGLQPVEAEANGANVVNIKINRGDGLKEIGASLSQESLIKSISVFKFYSLFSGKAQKFQPGVYELEKTMSVPQIINLLITSGKNEVLVTLPEGSTAKDIDTILSDAGVIEKRSLVNFDFKKQVDKYPFLAGMNLLEGFLFPDTYRFEVGSNVEVVFDVFLQNFVKKAWPLLEGKKNWYDLLILSSFLEREVPDFNDRRMVAGILLKRLKINMPLQVDATLGYIKCAGETRKCPNLMVKRSDLTMASPYNTYEKLGFTPTPISNPGASAISASLNPQISPYLYYLSASRTKETLFSKTLEEHNSKRAKYL